jgi:hypothetical protein
VPRGVDEVDKVASLNGAVSVLLGAGDVVLVVVVKGNAGGLDGDTSLLLVLSCVSGSGGSSSSLRNNSGLCDKGVSEGRLSMVDVGNH